MFFNNGKILHNNTSMYFTVKQKTMEYVVLKSYMVGVALNNLQISKGR